MLDTCPRIGTLGPGGKVDCVRRRDGMLIPYEHKRGRSARGQDGVAEAWLSDRLQVVAYAALLEEHTGRTVTEGRVRYHADNTMVRVPMDAPARTDLHRAIARACLAVFGRASTSRRQ